jgi:hypothetical protein
MTNTMDLGLAVLASDEGVGAGGVAALGAVVVGAAALGAVSAMRDYAQYGLRYHINPMCRASNLVSDDSDYPGTAVGVEWVIGPESAHPERLAALPMEYKQALIRDIKARAKEMQAHGIDWSSAGYNPLQELAMAQRMVEES